MMDIHKARWPGWQGVRAIGSGGAGEVYEIQREVYGHLERAALKVISLPQDVAEIQELFRQGYDPETVKHHYKARLDALVNACSAMLEMKGHANVIYCDDMRYELHDDGIGWDLYIKMELLTPLTDLLAQDVSDEQVIRLGVNMCDALSVCAQRGIVHEAVKPENIFLSVDGSYKLGDFGAARATGKPCGGDLTCMAPEVYWGMPYGTAADIYALGIVMYRMLNGGCLPFTQPESSGEEAANACVRRLTGEELTPPCNGSPALRQLVLRACAYAAADRFASLAELREALLALAGPEAAIAAAPVQAVYPQSSLAHPELSDRSGTWQQEPVEPIPVAVLAEDPKPAGKPAKRKNKGVAILLVAVLASILVLGVVCFFTVHIWTEPSCNEVKQCRICGKTGAKAEGHQWLEATCQIPQTCAVCGETQAEALGHQWIPATRTEPAVCSVCGVSEGTALQPELWMLGLISSGWEGEHKYSCEGGTATLSFEEDPDFAKAAVSVTDASGAAVDSAGFAVSWEGSQATVTPVQGLELGVYNIQFQGADAGAVMTLCCGYGGEVYLRETESFWSGNTWCSEAHGRYLAIADGRVTTVENAGAATSFSSDREMIGLEPDSAGTLTPVVGEPVRLQTMTYVRDGQTGLTVFSYDGWYLACDSQGTVYMTRELGADCFWLANR